MSGIRPLHDSAAEHDACGIALVADLTGADTHDVLARGLEALRRLTHRGAVDERGHSVDGAGVLTAIPWALVAGDVPAAIACGDDPRIAGTCFLPAGTRHAAMAAARSALAAAGWNTVGWRDVPLNRAVLPARSGAPDIVQVFAAAERRARPWSPYRTRLTMEAAWRRAALEGCTVISLSDRTILYKALVAPIDLPRFFPDLEDPRFTTPFIVAHQRFSTNTLPRWELAQPFGVIAHNGEINTIRGNRLWMAARLADADAVPDLGDAGPPAIRTGGSDSQTLDDVVELLRESGLETPHALARLFPLAWERDEALPEAARAFHRYESCFTEPWEGPAAIVFADGRSVGALVDRNGFRPLRTIETTEGLVCAGSEAGLFDIPANRVARRGRLGPGEMLVVNLEAHTVLRGGGARADLARRRDYDARLRRMLPPLEGAAMRATVPAIDLDLAYRRFGWTREEIDVIVRPMACDAHEAVGSMGDDTTLAPLADRSRPLSDYFRQRFAQVTNPPLDPLREALVMSPRVLLGRRGSWRTGTCDPTLIELDSPLVTDSQLAAIVQQEFVPAAVVDIGFDASAGGSGLRTAVADVQNAVCERVRGGAAVVVLTDRCLRAGEAPVPALLAASAVDEALRASGLRLRASLVVETGDVRDAHQVAALCAFGAAAVLPYVLYETAAALADGAAGARRCRDALEEGLLKILSKMGVCTVEAYVGSRLFDPLGLDQRFVDEYFGGLRSPLGGLTLDDIAEDVLARPAFAAPDSAAPLPHPGFHAFRHGGDHHMFHPVLVRRLHHAAREDHHGAYAAFAELAERRPASAVRDLLEFVDARPVPVREVESVESLCRRFFASAMSLGALSPEAHRALAIAMNRLGARSNCGEGGEEPDRLAASGRHRHACSATKQVASARFGVTPAYLISASELQIKMAQGSKPGEGGQLPGAKVDDLIARIRHTAPGTPLVSPPPHHDIYSIEDLAQLIYDLRAFHPAARMNVKLVAQAGIGVVAMGVVKAGADAIQISGHAGGTGASPRGSIKHAGAPWELGLAEAHQALVGGGLRGRVVLQVDGGLQTGRDLAVAAALGAQEFGFGSAALVALGCVMARQCHANTCPVGIATQRPELRAKFLGTPEMVEHYLRLVAADLRAILARLGVRRLDDLVGRTDLLRTRAAAPRGTFDAGGLLARVPSPAIRRRRLRPAIGGSLNEALARAAQGRLGRTPISIVAAVRNTDRTVGAPLAGRLAQERGDAGTAHAPVELRLTGSAGQSLWAFALPGMHVRLVGEANDGLGKGMHGGEIVIRPPAGRTAASSVLVGNSALYGATGGRVFIAGSAGERFAVRNSGAWAVVEGAGDHACEYMTAGAVLVLGPTGRNVAAGMTGGVAYFFDQGDALEALVNRGTVALRRGLGAEEPWIRAWLVEHRERTGSAVAADLLSRWGACREAFWTVTGARADAAPVAVPARLPGAAIGHMLS